LRGSIWADQLWRGNDHVGVRAKFKDFRKALIENNVWIREADPFAFGLVESYLISLSPFDSSAREEDRQTKL
jgi:hypothetical protein